MRRRILAAAVLAVSTTACGGSSVAPDDEGAGDVFPHGSYSLLDSVANDRRSSASGELTVARDSSYLWTMGSARRAGYLHGPVAEVVLVDTTSRGFVGVWLATATTSQLTIRSLNESVVYHFRAK